MFVYAIVVASESRFDDVAAQTTGPLQAAGVEPLWLSNPMPVAERETSECDFEVHVFSHGEYRETLDANDERRDERSTLEHLVTLTTRMLRAVHDRVDYDTWQNANSDAAAALARALDGWDDFVRAIEPEEEG